MIDQNRPRLVALRDELVAEIPCDPEEARADLLAMPLSSVLVHYMNWADRVLPIRPRKVLTWSGFNTSERTRRHAKKIRRMIERIEKGEDLKPFLSERVAHFGYIRPDVNFEGKRRGIEWGDKDYALNIHEVHHLHLGDKIKADGWSERTSELLFVQFGRDEAGLVYLGNHRSFDDGSLAQAISEAQVEGGHTVRGLTGEIMSPKDRNRLQRHGMMTAVAIGDKVVHSGFYSSAGTSMYHSSYSQHIMRLLDFQEPLLDDPSHQRKLFDDGGLPFPEQTKFSWRLNGLDFGAYEELTRTFFAMRYWRR